MLTIDLKPYANLETGRLVLRMIKDSDAERLFQMRSDPAVMQFIDRAPMQRLQEAQELIQKIKIDWITDSGITWAITQKPDEEMIGTLGFWRIDKENHRAEIGYMMLPLYQGQGLMREAITRILETGFRHIGFHSVEANINPHNDRSRRLLESVGFVQEAYFRENYFYNDRFFDSAIFSLIDPGIAQ
jgi:ribosomal-protein-alanine N-acetyltransferase